ncbi:M24 family metallopeptidase [Natrialba taiwanensis]|uniref:Peptidase M24 n=1 Tax=Natrialba taiwanensis DSM 12281 TaxID=1230458 RepID=M0AGJ3_9EURY|nr:Xaa-Pro peptidase family protein [Natrialba taiwanensis]ELY96483.1 peptidase M24 [Natrialba taiwanensis DSM 12281]
MSDDTERPRASAGETPTAIERRLAQAHDRIQDAPADALVLFPSTNLAYLSGFDEEPMERHLFLFVTADEAVFLAPTMYDTQLAAETPVSSIRTWDDGDDPTTLLATLGNELGIESGRLLVDDRMWARFTQDLRKTFPEATFGLASQLLDDLRIRKDDRELDHLRAAATIADDVSSAIRSLGADAIGLTETELADEIETRLSAAGGNGVSFETVVGSGPNGARPHHRHTDRTIRHGDPVVLDFGTVVNGYPSDQTRTVVFAGDPPAGFEDAHDAVLAAQQAAIRTVEPGIEAQEIDHAARNVLDERGYGDRFIHRTGHGVGLEVHEPPYITDGNDLELEPGMVFSIEPGVYLDDEFGIRIEDLVVVTDEGCERLNRSPRTWEPVTGADD